MRLLLPRWLDELRDRLYVALLSGLYVEALLKAAVSHPRTQDGPTHGTVA